MAWCGGCGFQRAVAALLDEDRDGGDGSEEGQRQGDAGGGAEGDERYRLEGRQRHPPVEMDGGEHRADDEEQQRHQHAGIAAAGGEQRAGGAAAPELHANAEHEGPRDDGDAERRDETVHFRAEQRAGGQSGEKQHDGDGQEHHLRSQATAAAFQDEDPPGGGEAEGRMVEREAERASDEEQRAMRWPESKR